MKNKFGRISVSILIFFITALIAASVSAADAKKTVTGVVTEGYQIITDDGEE